MKILIFSLSIVFLALTSCQTANFGNFNNRKFTNLKPLQSSYSSTEQLDVANSNQLLGQNDIYESEEGTASEDFQDQGFRLHGEDPVANAIQDAIKKNTPIIIKSGKDYFVVKEPFYDKFSKDLIGKLEKIETPLKDDHLELSVRDYRTNPNGKSEISIKDVTQFQLNKKAAEIEVTDEEILPSDSWSNSEAEPKKEIKPNEEGDEYSQKARKTFWTGAGFVGLTTICYLGFIILEFLPIIVLMGIAFLAAFILMCITTFLYKKSTDLTKRDKKMRNFSRFYVALGLVFLGIGFLIGLAILIYAFL